MEHFPEPHIELAPLRERAAIWIIAALAPWVAMGWCAHLRGWLA